MKTAYLLSIWGMPVSTGYPNKFWIRILQKMSKSQLTKKVVKVCLHSNKAVQISPQFDEFLFYLSEF